MPVTCVAHCHPSIHCRSAKCCLPSSSPLPDACTTIPTIATPPLPYARATVLAVGTPPLLVAVYAHHQAPLLERCHHCCPPPEHHCHCYFPPSVAVAAATTTAARPSAIVAFHPRSPTP
ncbi:hypothetical protein ACJRO7_027807 [Eucalyptus globulus]|uniref:Uncharacterized protein n=1 Tax=Eucalyptus globulus TaxID=34317 RepID=A0ABD3JX45_EUCGL